MSPEAPATAGRPFEPRPTVLPGPAGVGPDDALGRETLYGVIGAVAQGPDPERVLPAIVDLLTDATDCHACFVYLLDDDRLVMRAASRAYAHVVGQVTLGIDDGVCGWVVRHDCPALIREHAVQDARMKLVPLLHEERFQSMVAVPLRGRDGVVIGVIVLHTEAPYEFDQEVVDFLSHVASLVTGAIDNARLYERERQGVDSLGRLAVLVQRLSGIADRAELLQATCDGTRELLGADRCRLHLGDDDGTVRMVAHSGTEDDPDGEQPPLADPGNGSLAARIVAGDAGFGILSVERPTAFGGHAAGLLETIAAQVAAALRIVDLIERLTEENVVRDLFDAIADGRGEQVAARARSARVNPERPHVVVVFRPLAEGGAWDGTERLEARLRRTVPGTLCDPGPDRLRALLPVAEGHDARAPTRAALAELDAELDRIAREERVVVGRSSVQARLAADRSSLTEAISAAKIARALEPDGGARAWDALGVYRYLVGVDGDVEPDTRHAEAVATLWAYDQRRGSALIETLERYLTDRSVVPTARALFIHPNTLRQRLERIEQLTGLTVADEDLVSLELAIKLHRLRRP